MNKKIISPVALLLVVGVIPRLGLADAGLLRTSYPLDDARGYCIDIAGFGANIRLTDPLQVHTCKYGASLEDQIFELAAGENSVYATEYDVCLAAGALEAGAELYVGACDDSPLQRWELARGRLSPASRPELCISLAGEVGEIAGTPALITPVYRRRDVSLENCEDGLRPVQTWHWSARDARPLSAADVTRAGMPEEIASALTARGRSFNGEIVRETAAMYASVPRIYEAAEIEVELNVAYGSDERQQFDIHTSTARRSPGGVPTVIVFHGGGLVGGNRNSTVNVANYFASLGFVGVKATYRFAPAHKWPSGAQDVAAAVTWLHENVSKYGGDPEQIFVMGLSSGAYHSATYVFSRNFCLPARRALQARF